MTSQNWRPWTFDLVVNAPPPAFALRTYLEQTDVRSYLRRLHGAEKVQSACEIGCGYGRILFVLGEFAKQVVGFERQTEFVEWARRLHPAFTFHQVQSLGKLPAPEQTFDFVLCFTVLQHLTDRSVVPALDEIKRILRPSGHVLICEETTEGKTFGDVTDDSGFCVVARTVEHYSKLIAPLRLLETSSRRVEPPYPEKGVGHFMLFRKD